MPKLTIALHIQKLQRIFPMCSTTGIDPIDLWNKLCKLERRAKKLAEDQCNKPLPIGYIERTEVNILDQLDALLGFKDAKVPVFCNGDPRGYALKIEDSYVRDKDVDIYRDLGGYGIICPEI
jgi:hypothetical protein